MQVKSSVGLAVGPMNASHWGQVLVSPTAYGIIEIQDPLGSAQQRGVSALSLLGQRLSRGVTSLHALEEIADTVNGEIVQSLVLFVPVGSIVYIVLRGTACVYLKRGSELASLMHQDGGISGEVKNGDTFLLASSGFSNVLSRDEITKLFDHLSPTDVAEKLTILLHEKQGGEGSAALVFGATLIEEESYIEEPKSPDEQESEKSSEEHPRLSWMAHITDTIKTHVSSFRRHPKKVKAATVTILIIFFILSVLLGIIKQSQVKKNQAMMAAEVSAQQALDEGTALSTLNPVKGRERLTDAKNMLAPFIRTTSVHTPEGYALNQLYQKITDNLTTAMHSVNTPLTLFYDMSLVKKGATATTIAIDGDTIAIGDQATSTLYTLSLSSKKPEVIGGGAQLKGISSVAIHGGTLYALTPSGITAFGLSSLKSSQIIIKSDSWGMVSSLDSFGGNLYLLDMQKSRIWKYVSTDTTLSGNGLEFSDIREYLNPDTLPDFSTAINMTIDSSVWVGTTKGQILRFTQGQLNPFVPQGVDPALGNEIHVYTTDDTKSVYVLDADNSRVVVLDKNGVYLAQYHWNGGRPRDFVVSEENKKILLLIDGKIYSVDLQ